MEFTVSVLPNEGAGVLLVTPKRQKENKERFALHFMETIVWVLVPTKWLAQDHGGLQRTDTAGSYTQPCF